MILAWRTRPDEVKAFEREGHRIGLDEAERIAQLRHDIHAEDVRVGPGAMEAHCRTACSAEEIEHPKHATSRFHSAFDSRATAICGSFGRGDQWG
jgi:hypothetical protein